MPNKDPSSANYNSQVLTTAKDANRPGYVQNYNFGFQGQVSKDTLLELDWRGSTGVRLHAAGLASPNQINPRELSRGAVLTQSVACCR